MREIKFRVWDKDYKKMHVCGTNAHDTMSFTMDGKAFYYNLQNGEGSLSEESSYILMQYTGLKDKNGKEIYEGDFFKDIADGYLWQVFYDEGCYYASSGPDTLMLQEFLMESGKCDVEIVGNIYENPGLVGESDGH